MLFPKMNNVHMIGMKFPIDVAFLSTDLTVLDVVAAWPGQREIRNENASHVLETGLGVTKRFGWKKGDKLAIEHSSSSKSLQLRRIPN